LRAPVSGPSDCREIEFPVIPHPTGDIAVIEGTAQVPFAIERVYYLYSVPEGARRGGHAHRRLRQVLIAVAGALDVVLDDARERRSVRLDAPNRGLYLPSMVWRELVNFADGTVCLVLASEPYDESDYIRDYDEYARLRAS
jgi:dTDP-4-dehydrorhamnose 3,5-epimerase-like enzyme